MFAGLFSKPLFYLGLIVVGLFFLWGISRNWNCAPVKPPRPPKSDTFGVVEVPTGASIVVSYGIRDRQRGTIALAHIQSPSTGPEAEASRKALEAAAGAAVRVEWQRDGILRGNEPNSGLPGHVSVEVQREAPDATDDATEAPAGPPEARPPAVGVVFGESGADLALEQIKAGMAEPTADAPKNYVAAYKEAKKNRKR
jgi:hypothetical protein